MVVIEKHPYPLYKHPYGRYRKAPAYTTAQWSYWSLSINHMQVNSTTGGYRKAPAYTTAQWYYWSLSKAQSNPYAYGK
jgi:hypothetical protein